MLPLVISNVVMLVVYVLRFPHIPPQIPFYYSLPTGEEQIGEWWLLFLIPLLVDIVVILNNTLQSFFFGQNLFVKRMIFYVNSVLCVFATIAFIRIIMLVS